MVRHGTRWLGLLAVLITTIGTVLGTWLGRTKTTVQEIPAEGMDPAPAQPEGTWTVSPEMYRWFQDQMASMRARIRTWRSGGRGPDPGGQDGPAAAWHSTTSVSRTRA
ncbi:hypothetical protein SCALM49S_02462 [Streptomyces californicus]